MIRNIKILSPEETATSEWRAHILFSVGRLKRNRIYEAPSFAAVQEKVAKFREQLAECCMINHRGSMQHDGHLGAGRA